MTLGPPMLDPAQPDLGAAVAAAAGHRLDRPSCAARRAPGCADRTLDLEQPELQHAAERRRSRRAEPRAAADAASIEFDLGALSLDLRRARPRRRAGDSTPTTPDQHARRALTSARSTTTSGDPLARKLELAEEFTPIGDKEGARDLLEEVLAKASGALKTKAQGMLDSLELSARRRLAATQARQ